MDIGIVLIAIITLLICVLPFIIMIRNKRKKAKEFTETIFRAAAKSGSKIDQFDRWNNTIIGVDNLNRKLFFYRKLSDKEILKEADLSDFEMCDIIKTQRNAKDYNGIQRLELRLISRDKDKPNTQLEFYNAEHDNLTIMDELLLLEKWLSIVNVIIAKN